MAVAKAIHKTDPLAVIADSFAKFNQLLQTARENQESLKNFESRFDAVVCRFNDTARGNNLPSSLVSFILLANSDIENCQRVPILAAAAPKANNLEDDANVLDRLKYEHVASIIRSSDMPRSADSATRPTAITAGDV